MIVTITLVITGIFTGMVTGLTGASGVLIVIPLITVLLSFPVHAAIGTSLLADVIASIPIAYTYYKNGNSDIKSGIWIAVGSILGAQVGAIHAVSISGGMLAIALSVFMVGLGAKMWISGIHKTTNPHHLSLPKIFQTPAGSFFITGILGFVLGLFTGFFGAGGGLLIFIVLYFVLKLPLKTAIGTSTLIMIITAFSGAVGYINNGNIDISAGLIIGFSAAAGGILSSYVANRVNDHMLAKAVGAVFVILALIMIAIQVFHL